MQAVLHAQQMELHAAQAQYAQYAALGVGFPLVFFLCILLIRLLTPLRVTSRHLQPLHRPLRPTNPNPHLLRATNHRHLPLNHPSQPQWTWMRTLHTMPRTGTTSTRRSSRSGRRANSNSMRNIMGRRLSSRRVPRSPALRHRRRHLNQPLLRHLGRYGAPVLGLFRPEVQNGYGRGGEVILILFLARVRVLHLSLCTNINGYVQTTSAQEKLQLEDKIHCPREARTHDLPIARVITVGRFNQLSQGADPSMVYVDDIM
jgi:hypothetical protein